MAENQQEPTLSQRVQAERGATRSRLIGIPCRDEKCIRCAPLREARAATDRAVAAAEARIAELEKLAEYGKTFLITHGGAVAIPASVLPEGVPSPYLGRCTCAGKPPSVPLYRDAMTHLDDCPAKDTGYPVGCIRIVQATTGGARDE